MIDLEVYSFSFFFDVYPHISTTLNVVIVVVLFSLKMIVIVTFLNNVVCKCQCGM